jgi:hypothetical protein
MDNFLSFRRMITPVLIEVLFVFGCLASFGVGLFFIGRGLSHHHHRVQALLGLAIFVLGPLVVRLYTEAIIVAFRINETLTDILDAMSAWRASAPPSSRPR